MLTGPGFSADIPGCEDIDVEDRLDQEEYDVLIAELQCVLDNPDVMSPEALAAAEQAEATAQEAIEERQGTTATGGEQPTSETQPEQ